jgi:hypothetical protein
MFLVAGILFVTAVLGATVWRARRNA